jgi:hypothetical protein
VAVWKRKKYTIHIEVLLKFEPWEC